jgi:hypothetical protein
MNDEETAEGEEILLRGIKKRIIPFDQDDPAIEPLFINYVHGVLAGGSAYLDVGVITLESFTPENTDRIGDFAVIHRLVMSPATLMLIREQVNNLLTRTEKVKASAK